MLVLQRTEVGSGLSGKVDGLDVAREGGVRVDVDEPGGAEAEHAAVGPGENSTGGLEVEQIRFKGAVHAPPVNLADDRAVIDAAGRTDDRFVSTEPALEAVPQVLDTKKLHRLIVLIGQQIDHPLCRRARKKRLQT